MPSRTRSRPNPRSSSDGGSPTGPPNGVTREQRRGVREALGLDQPMEHPAVLLLRLQLVGTAGSPAFLQLRRERDVPRVPAEDDAIAPMTP